MPEAEIKYILFDAANTLIHKPDLWGAIGNVLQRHGINVPLGQLQRHHKLLSELTDFPDRTSGEFYNTFNRELLLSLGIIPTPELIAEIFKACSYLPWAVFEDTAGITQLGVPVGVVSNFNKGLTGLLNDLFGPIFSDILVSEDWGVRKPDLRFYEHALKAVGLEPGNVLYIGDSLKLDILPAAELGIRTLLIDRIGLYVPSPRTIHSLTELKRQLAPA